MTDVLDVIRRLDPAARIVTSPPEPLLEAILAQPEEARPTRHGGTRIRLVTAASLIALVTVAVIEALPGGSADLAARAYAQTDPSDAILHSVATTWVTTAVAG